MPKPFSQAEKKRGKRKSEKIESGKEGRREEERKRTRLFF